ncbi:hypothetical protein ACN4FT_02785 [Aliarcobacter butzleri]|uniref:hypothetical protein n=1 Tax=Aliarcobacter butzleri TaxID=28197 RepID=UPI00102D8686|nr:hypothetical protein [Aliarcobacter butzleri]RZV14531.1 hypothetical protein D3M61_04640 [Aliarcobacter butzleri]
MNVNINQSEILIDKMLDYYSVVTYSELAGKINTTQQTISSWKQRNSVNAIKKKCKELGIYNEIFGYLSSNISNFQNSNNTLSGNSSLLDLSNHKNNTNNQSNFSIPETILIELNSLFERIKIKSEKDKDENLIKEITYEIEDFINDLKKRNRN